MSGIWKKYTIKSAKELDLVEYFGHIGHDYVASYSRGKFSCYYSPFRPDERSPSFKIEKGTQHWMDFGKAMLADPSRVHLVINKK